MVNATTDPPRSLKSDLPPAPPAVGATTAAGVEPRLHRHRTGHRVARAMFATAALLILVITALAGTAAAQRGGGAACEEEEMNMQCNEFGTIKMENQREVRGKSIDVTSTTVIDQTYANSGARWVMFSVRHDPRDGASPVSLTLKEFSSVHGAIFTSRVDHDVPNEINLWVHVVDVPTDTPITLTVSVDVSRAGAFPVETLVMPFDRGYEPLRGLDGEENTLFASTLLGVNEPTGGSSGKGGLGNLRTPGFTWLPSILALVGVALLVARRRRA